MEEVRHGSVTELTTRSIRNSILSGEYHVGDKLLTENKLSQQLNVSRTVVREAMRILATEGYIQMVPGRGAFVACTSEINRVEDHWFSFSLASFHDLMEVRIPIEVLSVSLAVERATPEDIESLERNFASFLEANQSRNEQEMSRLDEDFHALIVRATRNNLLVSINKQLAKAYYGYRHASFSDSGTYANAVEPHRQILNAFKNRDSEQAVCAMRYHMERAVEDITQRINK